MHALMREEVVQISKSKNPANHVPALPKFE